MQESHNGRGNICAKYIWAVKEITKKCELRVEKEEME